MRTRFLQELHTLAGDNAQHKNYLVAVSGGADSIVTATLFHECGLQFSIAHCNFHLRGTDSDRDMHFVEKMAATWQVPFLVQEFDTLAVQKNSGKSVEMVARDLRYEWFSEIMAGFDHLVTAHHATDAAETTLLNLCRGTGLKGLCGIPPVNGKIIRPMLSFTAEEIRQYAEQHHIEYVEDYTNSDEDISRNRIRHSVIPQLETINPQFLQTNIHTRHILQQQYAFYHKHMVVAKQALVSQKENQILIDRNKLSLCEDKALILYEILHEYGFTADTVEKIAEKEDFSTGKLFYSETHKLLTDRDSFIIEPLSEHIDISTIDIHSLKELASYFTIEEFEYRKDIVFDKNPNILYIPKEKLTFPVQIRPWRHGDLFYPLGGKGRQKLSDFFTDHKIDRFSKDKIRLLCIDNQIVWIIGWRSDDRWKIQNDHTIALKLTNLLTF